jgi:anti-sigma B factor antagonist
MDEGFEARVSWGDDGGVVHMTGTVNRLAKDGLEGAYEEATSKPGRVLLDFGDVDYINSTGIAVIVGVLARARAEGREVGAFGLTDHYREVFQITRLADFMAIYEDEDAAVAAR